jgi:hypothetical protein
MTEGTSHCQVKLLWPLVVPKVWRQFMDIAITVKGDEETIGSITGGK